MYNDVEFAERLTIAKYWANVAAETDNPEYWEKAMELYAELNCLLEAEYCERQLERVAHAQSKVSD